MSQVIVKKGTVQKLNTQFALLITGGPYLYIMNGNVAPKAGDAWHVITGPHIVPQGVGAWITGFEGDQELVISAFTPSDQAPVNPIAS